MCSGRCRCVRDGIGVETQLQDVARFGIRSCELGVHRLVPDGAVRAFDPFQEVGYPRTPSCTNGIW